MLSVPLPEAEVAARARCPACRSPRATVRDCGSSRARSRPSPSSKSRFKARGVEARRLADHRRGALADARSDPRRVRSVSAHAAAVRADDAVRVERHRHVDHAGRGARSRATGCGICGSRCASPKAWRRSSPQTPSYALLEVGPGRTLTSLAQAHPTVGAERTIVQSLRHPQDPIERSRRAARGGRPAVGRRRRAELEGVLRQRAAGASACRPTPSITSVTGSSRATASSCARTRRRRSRRRRIARSGPTGPVWRPARAADARLARPRATILVFEDATGVGRELALELRAAGHIGRRRASRAIASRAWTTRRSRCVPTAARITRRCCASSSAAGQTPSQIVHLWAVGDDAPPVEDRDGGAYFYPARRARAGAGRRGAVRARSSSSSSPTAPKRPAPRVGPALPAEGADAGSGARRAAGDAVGRVPLGRSAGGARVGAGDGAHAASPRSRRRRPTRASRFAATSVSSKPTSAGRSPRPHGRGRSARTGVVLDDRRPRRHLRSRSPSDWREASQARFVLVGRTALPPRERVGRTARATRSVRSAGRARSAASRRSKRPAAKCSSSRPTSPIARRCASVVAAGGGAIRRGPRRRFTPRASSTTRRCIRRSATSLDAVLRPKVRGRDRAGRKRCAARRSTSCTFFSSTSAALGPAGQTDYVAANAFLNAYARQLAAEGVPGARGAVGRVAGSRHGGGGARRRRRSRAAEKVDHPLLQRRAADGHGTTLFRATLDVAVAMGARRTSGPRRRAGAAGHRLRRDGARRRCSRPARARRLGGRAVGPGVHVAARSFRRRRRRSSRPRCAAKRRRGRDLTIRSTARRGPAVEHSTGRGRVARGLGAAQRSTSRRSRRGATLRRESFGPGEQLLPQERLLAFGTPLEGRAQHRVRARRGARASRAAPTAHAADLDVFALHPGAARHGDRAARSR